ncbi:hypothetical protein JAAARDRAFT_195485 [Jaapia argillacea MUCL 33604]|uniref:NmrA-like domain-containing protein n=1 Tax=Jaapia argillacea MUCL 33604 TaxID=933084 RepID=A0A067PPB1_9AGAM|nr:hypothetical protein JAAARDRAFT_195485 [Jaapia argillacea MUCL 33604]
MVSAPTVALIGPTGLVGSAITPTFVQAALSGEIAELRLLTTDLNKPKVQESVKNGDGKVKAFTIDYDQPITLEDPLRGVDVIVSAMGAQGDMDKRKSVLVEAAVKSGVKVYLPSEWGTDHTRTNRYLPLFEKKHHHVLDAQSKGLKVVAVYIGLIMEIAFCKWFGVDSATNTWIVPGTGDQLVAITSKEDVGKYALRVALLSFTQPDIVPTHVGVYSDNRSWNTYADIMGQVAGKPVRREYLTLDEVVKRWDIAKDTLPIHMVGPLIPVLSAENVFDHSGGANELLNPGQRFWKPKTVDDYAREVGGQPWLNSSPL